MLPYLIAGAIGYGIAKLFEDDKAPKYADGGSVLLAPNGKPSNLTPEQYKLVRTPEFKAWFGDWENDPKNASKVVDENGEPLVCYHGGKTKFNIFSPYSEGHYFTDNIKYAKAFVENNDDGYLFKCFINVRNYLDARKLSPPTPSFNEINEKELMMFFKKNGIYSKEMEESIKDFFANKFQPKTFWNYLRYYGSDIPSSYKEIYDAIFLNEHTLNGTKINAYFVHKPNQIKLADGTNTTFDSNNPDIRFAGGGKVLSYNEVLKKQQTGDYYFDFLFSNENSKFIEETIDIRELRELNGFSDDEDEIEHTISYFNDLGMDEDYEIGRKLMNKIVDGVELSPIVVDEEYKLLDGWHRLSAYSELYYYFGYDYPFDGKLKIYKRISN